METYFLENFDIMIELTRAPQSAPIGTQPLSIPFVTPLSKSILYIFIMVSIGIVPR